MGDNLDDKSSNIYGDVCIRKKQRRKRQKTLIIELLYEYAKNSTLHGLRYIVDRGVHAIEQVFWLLTFLISVGMCFYLISNVFIKWKTSPVIVSFSERVVPVGDVPFPSITICPQMKSKASVYNFSDEYRKFNLFTSNLSLNMDWNQWEKLDDIDMVCGKGNTNIELNDRDLSNGSMIEHFLEVAPTVDDVFLSCLWQGKYQECGNILKSVLTSEGICYNFNALAGNEIMREEKIQRQFKYLNTTRKSADWSITGGYTNYRANVTYPRRARENNALPDLVLTLQEDPKDRDGLCNSIKSGYKIYVQHPADLPQASLYYYAALHGQVSSLALKFTMLMTADSLKGYTPEARQCYFPQDRYLRYFRIYTPSNCRLECQSNYTFSKCQCVFFHMPHSDSREICTSTESFECMVKALDELSIAELNGYVEGRKLRPCQCLPSCDSVQYDAEILKTEFNLYTYLKTQEKIHGIELDFLTSKNLSQIEVYFKEPRFISMRRSELFGLTDFLANCGGLLGLFLGFSFLSLVEIAYFLSLRLFYILKKDIREEKASLRKKDSINSNTN